MQSESHKLFVPVLQLSHGGPRLPQIDATEGDGLLFAALEDGQRSGGHKCRTIGLEVGTSQDAAPPQMGWGWGQRGKGVGLGAGTRGLGVLGS